MSDPMPGKQAEIQLSKVGPNGRPIAEIHVNDGTSFDAIVRAQKVLYRDLLPKIGLKAHEGCFSGVDLLIRRRFDDVTRVDLEHGTIVHG